MESPIAESRVETAEFCREIEAYLCRKNDGHLIRVVGPSFDLVSAWAAEGVPLKIAFRGIDRYFDRYYKKGPKRRPVRIDFCEADVRDAFDQWRRSVGIGAAAPDPAGVLPEPGGDGGKGVRGRSLPGHLERVVLRLTAARADGRLGAGFDDILDRVARELDAAREQAHGLRGEARQALVARLDALDAELMRAAEASLDEAARSALVREAEDELSAFRGRMAAETFSRTRDAAVARLVRERFNLPIVSFT